MNAKKVFKAFSLYKDIKDELSRIESGRPEGRFGILVDDDVYAQMWRAKRMRLEIVESFLEQRPANWHHAAYLSTNEAQDRNNMQLSFV